MKLPYTNKSVTPVADRRREERRAGKSDTEEQTASDATEQMVRMGTGTGLERRPSANWRT